MSRYTINIKKEERPWTIHPIWRGIGCLWFIILPIMSYAASWVVVRQVVFSQGFQNFIRNAQLSTGVNFIPESLYQLAILPSLQISWIYIDFNFLIRWLPGQPLYWMDFFLWGAFIFIGVGIASMVYALLYRSFGPPKSPYEAVEEPYRRRGPYG